ncbi:MAG: glycosyltransferase [Candidatus Cloacimonetes bacterium]|nr:glycosyltransferase [Candidatus Cloacimonadota bacterium]NLO11317.1 glycosyltransferase [Candidatus Cloacimonadota bacterium]
MKIAILGPAPPYKGGISQFALSLAETFLKDGHTVKLFGFEKQYPRLIFPGKTQTAEFEVDPQLEIINSHIPYLPWTWVKAVKAIKEYAPDILIISYFLPFFAPSYIHICKKLPQLRKIALVHNLLPHERIPGAKTFARLLLTQCQMSVCLSQTVFDELKSKMPNHIARKARLGFHPIYDKYLDYKSEGTKREPFTMLFFGLIKRYKGLDILLKAVAIAKAELPQLKLLIAGEVYGADEEYLNLIQELDIEGNVEPHLQFVPDTDVAVFFQRASLCVLPYRDATQSGIIALAYAFGLPVLASRLPGMAQYIDENRSGLMVDANPEPNPEALAAAIVQYFSMDMYEKMHPQVIERAQEYTWQKLAELVLE